MRAAFFVMNWRSSTRPRAHRVSDLDQRVNQGVFEDAIMLRGCSRQQDRHGALIADPADRFRRSALQRRELFFSTASKRAVRAHPTQTLTEWMAARQAFSSLAPRPKSRTCSRELAPSIRVSAQIALQRACDEIGLLFGGCLADKSCPKTFTDDSPLLGQFLDSAVSNRRAEIIQQFHQLRGFMFSMRA